MYVTQYIYIYILSVKMSMFSVIAMFILVVLLITLMVKIAEFQSLEQEDNRPCLRGRRSDWLI